MSLSYNVQRKGHAKTHTREKQQDLRNVRKGEKGNDRKGK